MKFTYYWTFFMILQIQNDNMTIWFPSFSIFCWINLYRQDLGVNNSQVTKKSCHSQIESLKKSQVFHFLADNVIVIWLLSVKVSLLFQIFIWLFVKKNNSLNYLYNKSGYSHKACISGWPEDCIFGWQSKDCTSAYQVLHFSFTRKLHI